MVALAVREQAVKEATGVQGLPVLQITEAAGAAVLALWALTALPLLAVTAVRARHQVFPVPVSLTQAVAAAAHTLAEQQVQVEPAAAVPAAIQEQTLRARAQLEPLIVAVAAAARIVRTTQVPAPVAVPASLLSVTSQAP
jgi:hypothetical protein